MLKKLFIKTTNPDYYFEVELTKDNFLIGCVIDENVPEWIRTSKAGRATLHPMIVSEANELGKSYDLKVCEPIQFWSVGSEKRRCDFFYASL